MEMLGGDGSAAHGISLTLSSVSGVPNGISFSAATIVVVVAVTCPRLWSDWREKGSNTTQYDCNDDDQNTVGSHFPSPNSPRNWKSLEPTSLVYQYQRSTRRTT